MGIMGSPGYRYDAFISHAVEDKIPIANELCERLQDKGLAIWYSGNELNVGDNISTTIGKGLNESRYGIVILSHNYMRKNWPRREFYTLLSREKDGHKVILPVLYNITPEELAQQDLDIAGRFAIKADKGLDYVVDKLVKGIHAESMAQPRRTLSVRPVVMAAVFVVLIMMAYGFYQAIMARPTGLTEQLIQNKIQSRIDKLQHKVDNQYLSNFRSTGAQPSEPAAVNAFFADFSDFKSYYRNEYEFYNGYTTVRARKNVEASLRLDLSACYPANSYQLQAPAVYLIDRKSEVRYAFVNTQPVHYTVSPLESMDDDTYAVIVTYENNIRFIAVNLLFAKRQTDTRWHRMLLLGLLPTETYVFERRNDSWQVMEVK